MSGATHTHQAILTPELYMADRIDALEAAVRHDESLVQTLFTSLRMAMDRIDAVTAENRALRQQIGASPSTTPSAAPTATPTLNYGPSAQG
jgi:hypothetical protein